MSAGCPRSSGFSSHVQFPDPLLCTALSELAAMYSPICCDAFRPATPNHDFPKLPSRTLNRCHVLCLTTPSAARDELRLWRAQQLRYKALVEFNHLVWLLAMPNHLLLSYSFLFPRVLALSRYDKCPPGTAPFYGVPSPADDGVLSFLGLIWGRDRLSPSLCYSGIASSVTHPCR